MSVTVTRTKAEQALLRNFEAVAGALPGGRAVAAARKAAVGTFAALGLPHRRIEEWKYTDLRGALKHALAPATGGGTAVSRQDIDAALENLAAIDAVRVVIVDGAFSAELSTTAIVEGLDIAPLSAALAQSPTHGGDDFGRLRSPGQEAVIALNTAFMTDGAVIRVAANAKLAKPILIVFARGGKEGRLVTTRSIVDIGSGAHAAVVEAHVVLPTAAPGQANTLCEVCVRDGAALAHTKVTLDGSQGQHLASCIVSLGARSAYRAFQLTASTGLTRNHLGVTFKGEDAKLDISGAFLGRAAQHIDTTLVVDHAVPGCESRELFKGVLADKARGVFQGKVIVRPDAQRSDGKQMAQALMLSQEAEFDSKPELEIHADDVVCGHGSTAAEIDPDLVFYLRARGIALAQARAMLIESFIGEAMEKIADERLREALAGIATRRLAELAT